jgi:hypothetical protein
MRRSRLRLLGWRRPGWCGEAPSNSLLRDSDGDVDGVGVGWKADSVVAGLVADQDVERGCANGSVLGELEMQGEVSGAFEEAGLQVEEWVEEDLRFGLFDAEQVGGVTFGESDDRGDGTSGGLFKGVEVPARVDLASECDVELRSLLEGFRGRIFDLPLDRGFRCVSGFNTQNGEGCGDKDAN